MIADTSLLTIQSTVPVFTLGRDHSNLYGLWGASGSFIRRRRESRSGPEA